MSPDTEYSGEADATAYAELPTDELQALSQENTEALDVLIRRRITHMHEELEIETFLSWHRGQELVTRAGAAAAIDVLKDTLTTPEAQVRVAGNWVAHLTNREHVDWLSVAELTDFQHGVAAAENSTTIG